jgi:hypothetical protein
MTTIQTKILFIENILIEGSTSFSAAILSRRVGALFEYSKRVTKKLSVAKLC